MQTTLERLDGDRIRIRVEVSTHDVDHAFEHAIRDLAKTTRVPGFRPGKAPATALRARLGNEAIVAEALDGHLGRWYGRALDQAGVEPVDRPDHRLRRAARRGRAVDRSRPRSQVAPSADAARRSSCWRRRATTSTLPPERGRGAPRADAQPGRAAGAGRRQPAPRSGMVALIDFVSTRERQEGARRLGHRLPGRARHRPPAGRPRAGDRRHAGGRDARGDHRAARRGRQEVRRQGGGLRRSR